MNRNTLTFGDHEMMERLDGIDHTLLKIEKLLDWSRFEQILSKVDLRNSSYYGRDCYSPIVMFRIMLIQHIYQYSDREMEDHLHFNYLYIRFAQLSLNMPIPHHTTICRWRERFREQNIYQLLFDDFLSQLEKRGIVLRQATIIDATLIQAHARPNRKTYVEVEPTGDETLPDDTPQVTITTEESKDSDARWLKKGKQCIYGYKSMQTVNLDGIVTGVTTTPASIPDCKLFIESISKANLHEGAIAFADKGFPADYNTQYLKENNLRDGIMWKKKANETEAESAFRVLRNQLISKVRYVVERTFGSLKSRYGYRRTPYIGLKKTHNYSLMGALTFNVVRSLSLL